MKAADRARFPAEDFERVGAEDPGRCVGLDGRQFLTPALDCLQPCLPPDELQAIRRSTAAMRALPPVPR